MANSSMQCLGPPYKCQASFHPMDDLAQSHSINSQTAFGVTISGEWAASPNDCGYFLRGVGAESTNPQCPDYDDYLNYNETMLAGIRNYVLGSMVSRASCILCFHLRLPSLNRTLRGIGSSGHGRYACSLAPFHSSPL